VSSIKLVPDPKSDFILTRDPHSQLERLDLPTVPILQLYTDETIMASPSVPHGVVAKPLSLAESFMCGGLAGCAAVTICECGAMDMD